MVETELFPRGALEYYTKKNMNWPVTEEEEKQWYTPCRTRPMTQDDPRVALHRRPVWFRYMPQRGGEQGDYTDGITEKIANVIDCNSQMQGVVASPLRTESQAASSAACPPAEVCDGGGCMVASFISVCRVFSRSCDRKGSTFDSIFGITGLRSEPRSKRAAICIPFSSEGSKSADWRNQGQTKCAMTSFLAGTPDSKLVRCRCVRELHLYIEDGKLKCTGIMRMQVFIPYKTFTCVAHRACVHFTLPSSRRVMVHLMPSSECDAFRRTRIYSLKTSTGSQFCSTM